MKHGVSQWQDTTQDTRRMWVILALAAALRLAIGAYAPLGVDEAYATAIAREFSWSFFDHPPLGFWAPIAMARLTGVDYPLVLRFPALLFGAGAVWLIHLMGRDLGGARAAFWSTVLFAVSPGFALAGVFILPDGPLAVFSAAAVLMLVRIVKAGEQATTRQWVWVGVWLALALASKYQAALIPVSALVFAVVTPVGRRWFARPGPYVASLVGLLGLLPVVLWNAEHGWASFVFHAGRTGDGVQLVNFARMVLGQFLYLLPPVLIVGAVGIWAALKSGVAERQLVALIALGPIVMFNVIFLFSAKSFPHWAIPGWQFSMPLAGVWLAGASEGARRRTGVWLTGFAIAIYGALLLVVLHVNTGILTRFGQDTTPAWDYTVDAFDYGDLRPALVARGDLADVALLAAPGWIAAGQMSLALHGEYPVRVLWGNRHHFAFMEGPRQGGTALLLEPVRLDDADARLAKLLAKVRNIDPQAQALAPVILDRGDRPYLAVNVIRMRLPPLER